MPEKAWKALLALVVLVFAARIASTYRVFNDTTDENDHIEAGIQYLQRGIYEYEPQHPPLVRVLCAALPYFVSDLRLTEARFELGELRHKPIDAERKGFETFLWAGMWREGTPEYYWKTLTEARAGNLPFGVLLLWAVYAWTAEIFGRRAGVIAALIASCSPTVLAHSGLATLDTAAAATTAAASYAFWRWTRQRTIRAALWTGLATALAFSSKFSTGPFLALIFTALFLIERPSLARRQALRQMVAYVGLIAVFIWAVYRFDFGAMAGLNASFQELEATAASGSGLQRIGALILTAPLPAPRFFQGLTDVMGHNAQGHGTYLLGEWSKFGRWLYFPVALAVKTTLPLLALAVWGFIIGWRSEHRKETLALAAPVAAVLLVALPANINIGIRHVLPLYPSLAMLAAVPFVRASFRVSKKDWKGVSAALLLVWHVGESAVAHPDYIPYFNQIARGRETDFLLDSNLDWGQDLARLGEWMHSEEAPESVILRYFGDARADKFGINTYILPPSHPDAGHLAISLNLLYGLEGTSDRLTALRHERPVAKIGKSIVVFRIPPNDIGQIAPPWFFERYEQFGRPQAASE